MLTDKGPIPTQRSKLNSGPTINAVRYKIPESGDEQVDLPNVVKESVRISKTDLHEDLIFSDEYSAYRDKFINMLTEFESMSDGDLGPIRAVQDWTKIEKKDSLPIHSAPYCTEPKAWEIEKQEINWMNACHGRYRTYQDGMGLTFVCTPKKQGTLHFCIENRKLNAVTIRDSYTVRRMDECVDSLGDATIFRRWKLIADIGK